jgi:hypothetical protein
VRINYLEDRTVKLVARLFRLEFETRSQWFRLQFAARTEKA